VSFRPGQRVRVLGRPRSGHHRTPAYVKGRIGRVERFHGLVANPESRAYGAAGRPAQPLYMVSFSQADLWTGYRGGQADRVCLDILGSWLEEAE
jgi:nitrile hydratase subunit beta